MVKMLHLIELKKEVEWNEVKENKGLVPKVDMIVDSYVKKNWSRIPSDSLDVYEDDFVGVISLFIALIYILYPCLSCLYVVIFFIKPIAKLMFWLTVVLVWYYHLHYRNVSHLNPYIWLLVVSCIFDSLTLDFLRIILVLTLSNKISFLIM